MKRKKLWLVSSFCFVLIMTYSKPLKAQAYLNPGVLYWSESSSQTSESSSNSRTFTVDRTHTNLNIGLGFQTASNLLVGVKYLSYSVGGKTKIGSFFEDDPTYSYSSAGVTIGYAMDGFVAQFSLLVLQPPVFESSDGNEKLEGGDGTILDLGYYIDAGGFSLGPQLSFVDLNYKKRFEDSEEDLDFKSGESSFVFPYFACLFHF